MNAETRWTTRSSTNASSRAPFTHCKSGGSSFPRVAALFLLCCVSFVRVPRFSATIIGAVLVPFQREHLSESAVTCPAWQTSEGKIQVDVRLPNRNLMAFSFALGARKAEWYTRRKRGEITTQCFGPDFFSQRASCFAQHAENHATSSPKSSHGNLSSELSEKPYHTLTASIGKQKSPPRQDGAIFLWDVSLWMSLTFLETHTQTEASSSSP